ncbi:RNA methyltransferase tRNA(m5U54)methyltransferase [Amphichorda felina]
MASDAISTGMAEQGGKEFRTVKEGKATILVPQGAKIGEDTGEVQQVFYNPIQQFNRDLSVLAIKTYGEAALKRKRQHHDRIKKKGKKRKRDEDEQEGATEPKPEGSEAPAQSEPAESSQHVPEPSFKILDALSASGLRALRYAHEIPFVTSVTANDLSASAAESIKANVAHNGLEDKIQVTNDDALAVMYRSIAESLSKSDRPGQPNRSNKWDVVDLDPYGTGAPFFDAAVQAVRDDGGLLCITCTDSAIWAGHSWCEKAFSLYGGTPVKGMHSHEVGLRLILHAIASSAARYGLDIEPLLSLSIDFYIKVFVKVTRSPQAVKFHGSKTMLVYSCDSGCGAWQTQQLMKSRTAPNKKGSGHFYKHGMAKGPTADQHCSHCGIKTHINGPMYGGRLHSPEFVQQLLDQLPDADPSVYGTVPRLKGMLNTALEEFLPSLEPVAKVSPKEDAAAAIDPYPFYFISAKLAGSLSCSSPPDELFRGALIHLGYRVTRSHCRPGSIKTDAPWSTIWWVMTEWIRQRAPIKASKYKPAMPGYKILKNAGLLDEPSADAQQPTSNEAASKDEDSKMEDVEKQEEPSNPANGDAELKSNEAERSQAPPTEEELRKTLVFNEDLARLGRRSEAQRLVRYQANPEKNWGPLNKAKPQ